MSGSGPTLGNMFRKDVDLDQDLDLDLDQDLDQLSIWATEL